MVITVRHVASTLIVLGAVALLSIALAQKQTPADNPGRSLELARQRFKWDEPADPVRIVGPVYSVGTKGLSVFLVKTAEGHIIINTGMPGSGPTTDAAIRKLGLDPRDVKLLLVGHAHIDHVGAHAYYQKTYGAKVGVIKEERALLESGGTLDFHYATFREFHFDPVKADMVFGDGDTIELGGTTITALLTNGHTRGSTTYVTSVVDGGKVFTVVFPNGLSINPGYRVAREESYLGIGDNFRRSLRVLENLKPDIWLGPHTDWHDQEEKTARAAKDGVKAWIDPDGYRRWLFAQRRRFQATVDEELGLKPKR